MQGYIEIRHIEIPSPEFLGPFTNISAEATTSESEEQSKAVPLADLAPPEDSCTYNNEEETSFAETHEEHTRTPVEDDKDLDKPDEAETVMEERGDSPPCVSVNSDIPVIVVEEVDGSASEPEQRRLWRNSQVLEEDQEGGLPKMAVALISRRSRHRAG